MTDYVMAVKGHILIPISWPDSAERWRTDFSKLVLKNFGFGHISVLKNRKNAKFGNLIEFI